ncbi:scavenger receptor cysteine-rich domain-containing protein DMBT1-like [Saccoglossus kowalevskii]
MCFKRKCLIANLLITMHVCISTVNGQVDVRLSGGVTPFQGNVEIRRDNGEWGLVCAMNTLKWDLMEARVVCKQLGFVDAMWTWSNSEYGVSNLSVRVFPGFLGRYKEGNPNRVFQTTSNMYTHGNSFTTIEGCIQTCRDNSKSIAVLNSADECYCGDDDTDYQQYGEAVPGEMINEYAFYGTQQCSGDTGTVPYIQGCGGDYQFDVYDTTIGACGGQYIDDSGYIYSPNFPDKYPRDQNCIWTITVEDNHIIQLSILMYKISTGDYVDIRDALSQCSKPGIHSHQVTTPSPLPDHFNPGDTISFRCTTGYTLNGVSVITCQDDGQWNSRVPTCTGEMINIALHLDVQLVIY